MKNKTILFDLQLSSFNSKGDIIYKSDSNYIFMRGLVNAIKDDYNVVLLSPIKDKTLTKDVILVDYGRDYYDARFYYDWKNVERCILEYSPDLIWTNNPIWVQFYISSLRILKKDIPIITYNHYIDLPGAEKYDAKHSVSFLQIDGMTRANLTLVNSEYGKKLVVQGMEKLLGKCNIINQIYSFPPPCLDYIQTDIHENYIVYNHRLSPTPYYKTAIDRFEQIIKRYPIEVIFTNPSHKDTLDFSFNHRYVEINEFRDYLDLLSKSLLSISCIFDKGAQWSMSLVDSIACRLPVLIPNVPGYVEIVPSDYPYFYETNGECISKFEDICKNHSSHIEKMNVYAKYVIDSYGLSKTRDRFNNIVGLVI